jgi:hypothetical protein
MIEFVVEQLKSFSSNLQSFFPPPPSPASGTLSPRERGNTRYLRRSFKQKDVKTAPQVGSVFCA